MLADDMKPMSSVSVTISGLSCVASFACANTPK